MKILRRISPISWNQELYCEPIWHYNSKDIPTVFHTMFQLQSETSWLVFRKKI